MLTFERLKELLSYDPCTGEFRWLVDRQRARKGSIAGTICPVYGYRLIGIDYKHYRANRLAFLFMTGVWPKETVDHIDRVRTNDAWSNLRDVSFEVNSRNRSVSPKSRSGVNGVNWQEDRQRWFAHVSIGGKSKALGRFKKLEDAIAARRSAEEAIHAA